MPRHSARQKESVAAESKLSALADEAVSKVLSQFSALASGAAPLPGSRARVPTREELRQHVDFLEGAVTARSEALFLSYINWFAGVTRARGLPVQLLEQSLASLRDFYKGRLALPERSMAVSSLTAALRALRPAPSGEVSAWQRDVREALPEAGPLADALLQGDLEATEEIVRTVHRRGYGYVELATLLFQPALYHIGHLWERNHITVAQEHLASLISQRLLDGQYGCASRRAFHGRRILISAVEGNHHALGVRIVADAFELAGWSVQCLGADTPPGDMVEQVLEFQPEAVGLSVSLVAQLPALQRQIALLRGECGAQCPVIMVGGIPTNLIPGLWRDMGADLWSADAKTAVSSLR